MTSWILHAGVLLALAGLSLATPFNHDLTMSWQQKEFERNHEPADKEEDAFLDLSDMDVKGNGKYTNHDRYQETHQDPQQDSVLGSLFVLGTQDIQEEQTADVYGLNINGNKQGQSDHTPVEDMTNYDSTPSTPLDSLRVNSISAIEADPRFSTLLESLMSNFTSSTSDDNPSKTQLLQFLENVRRNAWGQLKSTASGYIQLLEEEYESHESTNRLPLGLMKKVLEMGDYLQMLHEFGRNINPELKEFAMAKMFSLFSYFPGFKEGTSHQSLNMGNLVQDAAWKAMHQFIEHVLWVMEDHVSLEELDNYKNELKTKAPLAALGLDIILGTSSPYPAAEGRAIMTNQGYVGGYSDGYLGGGIQNKGYGSGGYNDGYGGYGSGSGVGYGGYGSHDGYGTQSYGNDYGLYLDPYLVLAGLGAAALLGFLGYKIILAKSTTSRRRRSLDDLTFSDNADLTHKIVASLETAQGKYGSPSFLDELVDLAWRLNSVWQENVSHSGCVTCVLVDIAANHTATQQDYLKTYATAGLVQLLGSGRSGQLLDQVVDHQLKGQPVTCQRRSSTCYLN